MSTLSDILTNPAKRENVVADLQDLVGKEVSDKSGVSGTVVKAGYATITKVKPGVVPAAVNKMLPQFADALDPFYADYHSRRPAPDFGAYLASRPDEAAEALLSVTDDRAQYSSSDTLKKAYSKMRPNARKNVEEALPRLGSLIEKHVNAV